MFKFKFGPLEIIIGKENQAVQDELLTRTNWNRIKRLVKKRDKAICYLCGEEVEEGTADHIIPISKGGTDSLDNLAWICVTCNSVKSDMILAETSSVKTKSAFPGRWKYFLRWLFDAQYHYDHDWWLDFQDEMKRLEEGTDAKFIWEVKESQRLRHFLRRVIFWPDFEGGVKFDDKLFLPPLGEFPAKILCDEEGGE